MEEEYIPTSTCTNACSEEYYPSASIREVRSRSSRPDTGITPRSSSREYYTASGSTDEEDGFVDISDDCHLETAPAVVTSASSSSCDEYSFTDRIQDEKLDLEEDDSSNEVSAVEPERINRKRTFSESTNSLDWDEAAYIKRAFELRGTITTVAQQLSASRQMEKSLKSRLKSAYKDIDDLEVTSLCYVILIYMCSGHIQSITEFGSFCVSFYLIYQDDKSHLRRDLREANEALRRAERLIEMKDDIINGKEMEIFIMKNDLELTKRSQVSVLQNM